MHFKGLKILEFNEYWKSDNTQYIIYADLESLIKKLDVCKSNPEKSSATKVGEKIPFGYSMSTMWIFDDIENKQR